MSLDEFLSIMLVVTVTVAYLGTVALFCFLVPRFVRGVIKQGEE
jgi:hypothetical protein